MPLVRCSSALVSAADGATDFEGFIVLDESLVDIDVGVRLRTWSCSGLVKGRPLGTSSDGRESVAAAIGDGSPLTDISLDNLLRSNDGLTKRESPATGPSR
jgi:hypothetical protein